MAGSIRGGITPPEGLICEPGGASKCGSGGILRKLGLQKSVSLEIGTAR